MNAINRFDGEHRFLSNFYPSPILFDGVPVATVSIGGAKNAGLLAARILGAADPAVQRKMVDYQARMAAEVERKDEALRQRLMGE